MIDQGDRALDKRIAGVSLFRRGKIEHGTLCLSQYHLTFTFTPNQADNIKNASKNLPSKGQPALEHTASSATDRSDTSTIIPNTKTSLETQTLSSSLSVFTDQHPPQTPARPRPRPKTLWIGYPMINHCSLRPSHAPYHASYNHAGHTELKDAIEDDQDLFPPTFGTNSSYARPSTDSIRFSAQSSPHRTASPAPASHTGPHSYESGRPPAIRIKCRDFQVIAFHFHQNSSEKGTPDEMARMTFFELRSRCCVSRVDEFLAFSFSPPQEEVAAAISAYDARRELARMGIGGKVAEGRGAAWRISNINHDYSFSPTYPSVICVPSIVSDNMLKYGGAFRSRARIPCLSYLHFNGGSITRSSQPLVGMQGKRNPQDERLVSAIFNSHTPASNTISDMNHESSDISATPPELWSDFDDVGRAGGQALTTTSGVEAKTLDDDETGQVAKEKKRIYGSTRRNYIVDARPKMNVLANRATGGGIEDVANYASPGETPVEKVYLNIANIHVMRSSLEKVVESLGNSDYVDLAPSQELLRKSGWLDHIANLLEGADFVARVVGLGGSHALIHCSDGWDRTSQISALAQILLDPHYRTIRGLITLIQKDFLSFGHKFRDRHGIQGSEKWFDIENERIAPNKATKDPTSTEGNGLNNFGSKALTGAKNWFEKNRSSLFRQQNTSREEIGEQTSMSLPPNPILHNVPSNTTKEAKKHEIKTDEIAPIFHQFLDAIYQLLRQRSNVFEYNEKLLLRLLYQSYSTQYGEFLFNNEQERSRQADKTTSVWSYFLARKEFINPEYDANLEKGLLLPERGPHDRQIDVRWWHKLFGREDREMNEQRMMPNLHGGVNSALTMHDKDSGGTAAVVAAHKSQGISPEGGHISMHSNVLVTAQRHIPQPSPQYIAATTEAKGLDSEQPLSQALQSSPLPVQPSVHSLENSRIPSSSAAQAEATETRPIAQREETDPEVLAKYVADASIATHMQPSAQVQQIKTDALPKVDDATVSLPFRLPKADNDQTLNATDQSSSVVSEQQGPFQADGREGVQDGGDPLGAVLDVPTAIRSPNVTSSSRAQTSRVATRQGLDFAAFASQNAFQDR